MRFAPGLTILVGFLAACGSTGGPPRPSVDLAAAASDDLSAGAADQGAPVDLAKPALPDLAAPDLVGLCKGCVAPTPVCDPSSGQCVACLPATDACAPGSHCEKIMGGYQCSPGCKIDKDCPAVATDGGVAPKPVCCNHQCQDVASSAANCGKCGMACVNAAACCGGLCLDVSKDAKNCGGCGQVCPSGALVHATIACVQSACVVQGCAGGYADCDKDPGNGCEAQLQTDPAHCGMCGMFCSIINGVGACNNGCVLKSCYAGFADCNKSVGDGCEAATTKDPQNCGACGKLCPAPPNATAGCFGGVCTVGGCQAGFGDCDGNGQNGCETTLASDAKHCGVCGNDCGQALHGIAGCTLGKCVLVSCTAPWKDCNNNPVDGCEANPQSDKNHCSGCGKPCPSPQNGVAACTNGMCGFGGCNPGFENCNANTADGCEVDLQTDKANCGGCGKACGNNMICKAGACAQAASCLANPQWMAVSCVTGDWVWSRDRNGAKTLQLANAARVLATGCNHGAQINNKGLCSLDGKGWVSTQTFAMVGCDATWYHLGGSFTGNCGGHDGDTWRHLALGDNDCFAY
ncbi:MAG: hypothetical protein EXR72_09360 [Myxococcales bacterium]|nr:hypothetical protein [Myxococcales bacterium]